MNNQTMRFTDLRPKQRSAAKKVALVWAAGLTMIFLLVMAPVVVVFIILGVIAVTLSVAFFDVFGGFDD